MRARSCARISSSRRSKQAGRKGWTNKRTQILFIFWAMRFILYITCAQHSHLASHFSIIAWLLLSLQSIPSDCFASLAPRTVRLALVHAFSSISILLFAYLLLFVCSLEPRHITVFALFVCACCRNNSNPKCRRIKVKRTEQTHTPRWKKQNFYGCTFVCCSFMITTKWIAICSKRSLSHSSQLRAPIVRVRER